VKRKGVSSSSGLTHGSSGGYRTAEDEKPCSVRFIGPAFTFFGFATWSGRTEVEAVASGIGFFLGRPRERFVGVSGAGTLKDSATSGSILMTWRGVETEAVARDGMTVDLSPKSSGPGESSTTQVADLIFRRFRALDAG